MLSGNTHPFCVLVCLFTIVELCTIMFSKMPDSSMVCLCQFIFFITLSHISTFYGSYIYLAMVMLKCTYFIYFNSKLLTLLYTSHDGVLNYTCAFNLSFHKVRAEVHVLSFWGKSLNLFCCSCCFQFVKYIALNWINQFNKVLLFLYHKQLLFVWRTLSKVLCLGFYDDESTSTAKM